MKRLMVFDDETNQPTEGETSTSEGAAPAAPAEGASEGEAATE